jgi:hypothetical protein
MADNVSKNKFKPAFGSSENIQNALDQGLIDNYDFLLLDGDTDNPKFGWVDKNGKPIVIDTEKVIVVEDETLPKSGEVGKIYIFGEDGYFWNGEAFINLCKPTDLTELESQVGNLENQIETKVDESTVQNMIQEYSCIEIVEF